MQRALPGSLLIHAGVIGIALVGFSWPEADDAPAAQSVSVSIVAMSTVSSNASEVVQSDSTENMTSPGATATMPPTLQAIEPRAVQTIAETTVPLPPPTQPPVPNEPVEPMEAEAIEPLPLEQAELAPARTDLAELSSTAISPVASQAVVPATPPALEPISNEEAKLAPVPAKLSFERPSKPTERPRPPQQDKPRPAAPTQAGNGGTGNADSVASAGAPSQQASSGNGGDAEVARYPSQVVGKLRRALRSGNGPRGEVLVRFTVHANGEVSGISVGRSSGNAAVDQAGLAIVTRAAPFPPIPPAAARADWTFDVPLAFGG